MLFRDNNTYYFSIDQSKVPYLMKSLMQSLHSIQSDVHSSEISKNEATKIITAFMYEVTNATYISEDNDQSRIAWEAFNYPNIHPSKNNQNPDFEE